MVIAIKRAPMMGGIRRVKRWTAIAILSVPGLFGGRPAFAQTLGAELERRVDAAVQDTLRQDHSPSASIAVVRDGKVAYAAAYGEARLDPGGARDDGDPLPTGIAFQDLSTWQQKKQLDHNGYSPLFQGNSRSPFLLIAIGH